MASLVNSKGKIVLKSREIDELRECLQLVPGGHIQYTSAECRAETEANKWLEFAGKPE